MGNFVDNGRPDGRISDDHMIQPPVESIGQRIKRLRRARSLSQAELSAQSGVPLATLKDVERGKVGVPQPRTLRKLAVALGIEPNQLRGEESIAESSVTEV